MKRGVLIISALISTVLLVSAPTAFAGGPEIEEGKWQITSRLEMPGMPADMPQQTFTHTQCLTKDDYVPKGSQNQSAQNCRIDDLQTSGNTVTWKMHCTSAQGQMDGEGRITYHGDSFEGTIRMTTQGGEMIQHMKGRRIGDCQ